MPGIQHSTKLPHGASGFQVHGLTAENTQGVSRANIDLVKENEKELLKVGGSQRGI